MTEQPKERCCVCGKEDPDSICDQCARPCCSHCKTGPDDVCPECAE